MRTFCALLLTSVLLCGCDSEDTLGQPCNDDRDCNAGQQCSPTDLLCELLGGDAGPGMDAGMDAGTDGGSGSDAGTDAGPDAAVATDSGTDGGGSDGGAGPTCGDGVLDVVTGEECDDGNTTPGDGCDGSCNLEPVGGTCNDSTIDAPLEKCDPPDAMPADGEGCNATCNLSGTVTTLRTVNASAMTSDNTYLYLAINDCAGGECGIGRIDIAACIAAPGTSACDPSYLSGGPGQCVCSTGSCPFAGGSGVTPAPAVTDGARSVATFDSMGTLTTDGTTIWIGHQQTIREVDIATGAVTTVAGTRGSCAAIDGTGTGAGGAFIHGLRGLTYHGGLVYFLDGTEAVLRTYDPSTRTVTTIAGTRRPDCRVTQTPPYTCRAPCDITGCGGPGSPSAGTGLGAVFVSPRYMTVDSAGVLTILDTNGEAILSYDTTSNAMSILVQGTSSLPSAYVDGVGSAVTIGRPRGIVSDGTSVYFGEQSYATIRQLQLGSLTTTTFVGTHGCFAGGATSPRDGFGANTVGSPYYSGAGGGRCNSPPSGTPIFNPLVSGAMSFHFPSRSIYVIDRDQLRRIE